MPAKAPRSLRYENSNVLVIFLLTDSSLLIALKRSDPGVGLYCAHARRCPTPPPRGFRLPPRGSASTSRPSMECWVSRRGCAARTSSAAGAAPAALCCAPSRSAARTLPPRVSPHPPKMPPAPRPRTPAAVASQPPPCIVRAHGTKAACLRRHCQCRKKGLL